MLTRILPAAVDNRYQGNRLALYFFYLITLVTIVRSCIHIFAADGGVQSIATIPLDSYTLGVEAVVFIFGQWGIAQLMVGLMYLMVALRYRCLVPLMYLFIFFEWSTRIMLGLFKSIETTGTAPAATGQIVLVVLVPVLFYLAVRQSSANQGKKRLFIHQQPVITSLLFTFLKKKQDTCRMQQPLKCRLITMQSNFTHHGDGRHAECLRFSGGWRFYC